MTDIKMTIDQLLQVLLHQLQDLDHLMMMMIIFLTFLLHNLLIILIHLTHTTSSRSSTIILLYSKSNIKDSDDDDDDDDFNINFPEKFLLSSGNTKKDVANALNNVKCELEMVREEKTKSKKRLNLQIM